MPKLTNIDKRQLTHSARGLGQLGRQSNFDKPEKRVAKLVSMGLLVSETEATEEGQKIAAEILIKTGHGQLINWATYDAFGRKIKDRPDYAT